MSNSSNFEEDNVKANSSRRSSPKPSRSQKAFYIQNIYSSTFEKLVYEQKKQKGLSSPELAELALELLFNKFNISINKNE